MPSVKASLDYLQRLPLYETEKPYWCFLPPREGFDPDKQRVDNLEFEERSDITIHDIRELENSPDIEDSGYQIFKHQSKFSRFDQADDVIQYKIETEDFLKEVLGGVYAKCYDTVLRKNIAFERNILDLADPLHTEGPARGVHNGKLPFALELHLDQELTSLTRHHVRFWSNDYQSLHVRPGQEEILETWIPLPNHQVDLKSGAFVLLKANVFLQHMANPHTRA
jgi:hypothetical protein